MVDKYYNFEELAANETYGVDYTITSILRPPSRVSAIAVHGGGIEIGTTELAREVSGMNAHSFYTFESLKPTGQNEDMHVTSIHFDEPQALYIQDQSDFTISFHGAQGDLPKSLMGGLDIVKRDSMMAALISAGFVAEIASEELNGDNPSNIGNKNRRKMCVQIELTTEQRRRFFVNGDWSRANRLARNFTNEFFKYVEVIAAETAAWDAEIPGSPNYRLNLAKPNELMSDFELWINSNYTKLEGIPAPPVIATPELPTSGAYETGDRIYHTATSSIYICVCNDVKWGLWWRPVQAAMSPWVDVPTTAVKDTGLWNIQFSPTRPLQIALDNQGRGHWRGIIRYIGGAAIAKNTSYAIFYEMPFGFRPRETDNYFVGHQTLNLGTTDWEGVRVYISDDAMNEITLRAQGGDPASVTINQFYFNGCIQYAIGSGHYTVA